MLKDYVVVDLEMTGLNAKTDRILEIGAIKVKDKQIQDKFSAVIRQTEPLKEDIVKLTGITDEIAAFGEELDNAMVDFCDFSEDLVWVGHNVNFDYRFVKQWEVNHRIKKCRYAADTLKIARKCLPELEKKTLEYLCEYFQIKRKAKHRAYEDAAGTMELYEILEHQFEKSMPELFVPRELQYSAKRQTPATIRQKKYLKGLVEYHRIDIDISIEQLNRSEASRLTDKIIHQYGKLPVLKES